MGKTAASAWQVTSARRKAPKESRRQSLFSRKIGKDVADDEEVGKALLARARSAAKNWDVRADNWKRLQVQLAAIDALGEVNKYRGGIVDKEVSILFSESDLLNPDDFIKTLADEKNPISICIWRRFSPDDKKLLQDPAKKAAALAAALNKILTRPSMYDPTCFANLPQQTKTLMTRQPTGEYLIRLELITDAYPQRNTRRNTRLG